MPQITIITNAHSKYNGKRVIGINPSDVISSTPAESHWIDEPLVMLKLKNAPSEYCTQKEWQRFLKQVLST